MASSSSSGLTFKLHPLVIVNISDHYTRVKSQMNPPITSTSSSATINNNNSNGVEHQQQAPRVYGCVIGVQRGRVVEIFNSFELLYDPSTHSLDRSFLEKKQELCMILFLFFSFNFFFFYLHLELKIDVFQLFFSDKKVFPHFYILGWYSTGSDAEESDMHIHKAVCFPSRSSLRLSLYISWACHFYF